MKCVLVIKHISGGGTGVYSTDTDLRFISS